MDKNICRIDTSGNTELKDFFARYKEGEECELTIKLVITENTPDGVTGKVKEIELPGDDEYDEETVTPGSESPVSVTVSGAQMYAEGMPE